MLNSARSPTNGCTTRLERLNAHRLTHDSVERSLIRVSLSAFAQLPDLRLRRPERPPLTVDPKGFGCEFGGQWPLSGQYLRLFIHVDGFAFGDQFAFTIEFRRNRFNILLLKGMIAGRTDARFVAHNRSIGLCATLAWVSVALTLFAQSALAAPSQTVNIQSTESTKSPDTSNRAKHPFAIFDRLPSLPKLPSLCSKQMKWGMRNSCGPKTCEDLRKQRDQPQEEAKPKDPRGYFAGKDAVEPLKPEKSKGIGHKAKEMAGKAKEAAGKAAGKAKELFCKVPLPGCFCPENLFEDKAEKNAEWKCKTKNACLGIPEGMEQRPETPAKMH